MRKAPLPASVELTVGERFEWQVASSDGMITVSYRTDNANIASVSSSAQNYGYITGVAVGTTTVRAFEGTTQVATITVVVKSAATAVSMNYASLTLGVGQTFTKLVAEVLPATASQAVEFASSNPGVASVDIASGEIKALSMGTTVVTAKTANGKRASCAVTVVSKPTGITVDQTQVRLGVGMTTKLSATLVPSNIPEGIYFKSRNAAVASIDSQGLITATGVGETAIDVYTYLGSSVPPVNVISVVVYPAPTSMSFSTGSLYIGYNETYRLALNYADGTMADVSYSSSDPTRLSLVSSSPTEVVITGRGISSTPVKVTAKAQNGVTASVNVYVWGAPTQITLPSYNYTICQGDSVAIKPQFQPGKASGQLTVTSSSPEVASYQNGFVKGETIGSTTLTFTTYNGVSVSCAVTVVAAPSAVSLDVDNLTLGVGMEHQFVATVYPATGASCNVTYSLSSGSSSVTVSPDGKLKATGVGSAVVLARTFNGKTTSCMVNVLPAPTGVKPSSTSLVIGLGDMSQRLGYQLIGSGACYGTVTFESSDETVLKVDATGLLTPVKAGMATVKLMVTGGATADCVVTVVATPTGLTLNPTSMVMGVGETRTVTATMQPASGARVTYVSNAPSVATVDEESGRVTALTTGTATIIATSYNGLQATCAVEVRPAPTSITLPEYSIQMAVGMRYNMQPTLEPVGSAGTITYRTSNYSAVSVSVNGILVARATGTAKITAQPYNGLPAAELYVTVVDAPADFDLYVWEKKQTAISIAVGESAQIVPTYDASRYANFTFSKAQTSNCIDLTADGIVTGRSVGYTDVTVTMHTGLTHTLRVTVNPQPTGITLPAMQTMGVGETRTVKATLTPANSTGHVRYASSNTEVATVDETTGLVMALKEGSTVITASIGGMTAQATLNVGIAPTSIYLPFSGLTLGVGMSYTVSASIQPANAGGVITYASENAAVASVNASGLITALKPGTAKIRVSTYNGKYNLLEVQVLPAPTSMTITPGDSKLSVGDTLTVKGVEAPGTKGRLLYYSSNTKVATVDVYLGTVKAVGKGTTTITCKAHNGVTASMKLEVVAAPTALTMNTASLQLGVGDTYTLKVTQKPSTAIAQVSYASNMPSVASVNAATGVVTAKTPGVAVITARTNSGLQASCTVTVMSAPTSVSFSVKEINVSQGSKVTVPVTYTTGTATTLKFSSATNIYATVYANQPVIYGRMVGDDTITVTTHNGLTDTILVHVLPAPDKLVLNTTSLNLGLGDTGRIQCSILNGVTTTYTAWAVDTSIVQVSVSKNVVLVTPKKRGTTVVTVRTATGLTANCQVTVTAAPTGITISPANANLGLSETRKLSVNYQPAGTSGTVTWSSNNPGVVAIDKDTGLMRALTYGSAVITAKTYNGKQATCTVKVYKDATTFSIPTSKTMSTGESYTFQPVFGVNEYSQVTYTSANTGIATVDANGVLRAKAIGTVNITGKTSNGLTAVCTVTVKGAPTSITLSSSSMGMMVGDGATLTHTLHPAGAAAEVKYTSSNYNIVWVHPTMGVLSAKSAGTATITATTSNGKKATCKVTVGKGPTSMTIYSKQGDKGAKIGLGQTFAIAWATSPAYSSITYTVHSSNPSVASIAVYGERMNVTGLQKGTTTLTIRASNGLSRTFTLSVIGEPTSLTLNRTVMNLSYKGSFQLTYMMGPGEDGTVTFSCDRPDLLSISNTGLLKPRGKPSRVVVVTVTATTYNGISTTCQVNVCPW